MVTSSLWQVLLLLLLGGVLYNWLVEYAQRQLPRVHGLTAWLVVVGVLGTLIGYLLLAGVNAFFTVLLCFMAAGTPMVLGSMRRYSRGGGR
jgi:hypothetical protein